ncbi:pyridoxine/pyridoxamine 5'-phosphate oxidase [Kineococcus terrestris]|uniref:pyridoxine/pyridoxamine 5'-phosphate oxidase n=1 Tax=Kineococcus terrestris TaxID=2044856 RepID=UPI0034DB35A1
MSSTTSRPQPHPPAPGVDGPGGSVRDWLEGLPLLRADPPPFDPEDVPADPLELFLAWLGDAVAAGVPDPHALTLATVDPAGRPDARVVVLRDVDESALWVASSAVSPKGRQLDRVPVAALVFHWPQRGRQVRVRGGVRLADPERTAADFLGRPAQVRADALVARQSEALRHEGELADELGDATDLLRVEPHVVAPTWRLWGVDASRLEFWQASPDGQHLRVRYDRDEDGGHRQTRLWP